MLFGSLLGGNVSGSSTSQGSNTAMVNIGAPSTYIPSAENPPVISPYPAGPGLATVNSYYPGAAGATSPSALASLLGTSSSSSASLLLLVALAVGAYLLLHK